MKGKESIKTWIIYIGWIVAGILIMKSCDWYSEKHQAKKHQAYLAKKRNDSIRKAFVKDSLAHDPHYQDSLRKEQARLKKWEKEESLIRDVEIAGFSITGDSVYHTSFHSIGFTEDHSYGFTLFDRPKLHFYTNSEIKKLSLKLCSICEEVEYVYTRYLDYELIDKDNARDYDLIKIEEASDYCNLPHVNIDEDLEDRY